MSLDFEELRKLLEASSIDKKTIDRVEGIIAESQETKRQLNIYENKKRQEKERHDKTLGLLAMELAAIQNVCKHTATKYYPDASGNNDSETVCLTCGKSI